MGERQSRQLKATKDPREGIGGRPSLGDLMHKISAGIGGGNEGDILDMQCTNHMDETAPHLWHSHTVQSTQESSVMELIESPLPEPPLRQARSLEYESISLAQLDRAGELSEEMLEDAFIPKPAITDSYEEVIMKLCD